MGLLPAQDLISTSVLPARPMITLKPDITLQRCGFTVPEADGLFAVFGRNQYGLPHVAGGAVSSSRSMATSWV